MTDKTPEPTTEAGRQLVRQAVEEALTYLTGTHVMKVERCRKTAISGEDWQFTNGYGAAVADLRARTLLAESTPEPKR